MAVWITRRRFQASRRLTRGSGSDAREPPLASPASVLRARPRRLNPQLDQLLGIPVDGHEEGIRVALKHGLSEHSDDLLSRLAIAFSHPRVRLFVWVPRCCLPAYSSLTLSGSRPRGVTVAEHKDRRISFRMDRNHGQVFH
jgi:hypothetical protein